MSASRLLVSTGISVRSVCNEMVITEPACCLSINKKHQSNLMLQSKEKEPKN